MLQGLGTLGAPALLAQLVEHLHGKEGVDGSSPSEGFTKVPAKRHVLLPDKTVGAEGTLREHFLTPSACMRILLPLSFLTFCRCSFGASNHHLKLVPARARARTRIVRFGAVRLAGSFRLLPG